MKMNKTYSRVVVPKDLDTGTSTETSTWIAKNISRVYYLPMVVSADADIKKNDLLSISEKLSDFDMVKDNYYALEGMSKDNEEIVLLMATSEEHLRETHPRYFSLDARPDIPNEIYPL